MFSVSNWVVQYIDDFLGEHAAFAIEQRRLLCLCHPDGFLLQRTLRIVRQSLPR